MPAEPFQRLRRLPVGKRNSRRERIIDPTLQHNSTCSIPESIQLSLEQKAEQAADVFQRSSSCVEGRNGQLSLRHHGLRELTASKLRALRTIHNYVIRSPDGTTAAERFFANKPRDLFRWLLDQLPMPARPRQKKN